MKTNLKILMLLAILSFKSYGQDSLKVKTDSLKTQIFSLSPISKKVDKVNGLVLGIGTEFLVNEKANINKINGMNIEINPISPLILLMADPSRISFDDKPKLTVNGLNITTGNLCQTVKYNGLMISAFNVSYINNGVSIAGIYNYSYKLNGMHLAGLVNVAENGNGFFVSPINDITDFNGFQIGIYNKTDVFKGVQIGILNHTKRSKGLQIGFWNKNNKRSLPFLNW